jgi:hypothetical protein
MGTGKRRIALLVFAMVAAGALASAASARRNRQAIAGIACARIAPGVCEESGDITLGPSSFGSQATDTVPTQSTEEDSFLEPLSKSDLADFDSLWDTMVVDEPKLAKITNVTLRRAITCAMFARGTANMYAALTEGGAASETVTADNLNTGLLSVCIQVTIVGQDAQGQAPRARSASSRCSQAVVSIPVEISRSGSGYTIRTGSKVSRAGPRTALATSCRVTSSGMVIKARPRRPGRRLRPIVGPKFRLAYSNRASHPVAVRATFRFS